MPTYSIAICNYNMGETIEESVQSILQQIDNRFEILIVDDGSTDNSLQKIRKLNEEHNEVRYVSLSRNSKRKLGETRNISVKEAKGEYVLLHLDADDHFEDGITDAVDVFHQIEEQVSKNFYMMSCSFAIAKREFLLEKGPYRNLPVGGEDQDLWRRLYADDGIIWVESKNIDSDLTGGKDRSSLMKRWFKVAIANFQTGISFWSYLQWSFFKRFPLGFAYDLLSCPVAYLISMTREKYTVPQEFTKKGAVDKKIEKERKKLCQIEQECEISIRETELTENARDLFLID